MSGATTFVSHPGERAGGFASLDPPHLQQTKTEIRSLASEIASLAHAALEPEEFYRGFLPRLCLAMGAPAAAVWQSESSWRQLQGLRPRSLADRNLLEQQHYLVFNHKLPEQLCDAQEHSSANLITPSAAHQRILACVVAEGSPILVPPGTVKLETDRPTNPLNDSLILIPIRVQEQIEYVLEVVQTPSGGPAAQRGYLRFVAQMADLMADYLRRQSLREQSQNASQYELFERRLTELAVSTANPNQQCQQLADSLAELSAGSLVLLMTRQPRVKLLAVSGLPKFDPRSETVLAAHGFERNLRKMGNNPVGRLEPKEFADESQLQAFEELCRAMASSQLCRVQLDQSAQYVALIGTESAMFGRDFELFQTRAQSLFSVCGRTSSPWWLLTSRWGSFAAGRPQLGSRSWLRKGAVALGLSLLAVAAGMIPVPQQITTSAVLTPAAKQVYYAPVSAMVEEIYCEDEQVVAAGTPLLKLVDRNLLRDIENLTSEQASLSARIRQNKEKQLRNRQSKSIDEKRLELELESEEHQLTLTLKANSRQLELLKKLNQELTIVAKQDGKISSWDVRNRLLHRPVNTGDQLISIYAPESEWQLQVSVPEHRVGLVAEALRKQQANEQEPGLRTRIVLASHPNQVIEASLISLAAQATRQSSGSNVVFATAKLPHEGVPLKKDGAVANATIECGRVSAVWLLVRDAYWAIQSRLQLFL